MIGERTRAALAAVKAKGKKLGGRRMHGGKVVCGSDDGRAASRAAIQRRVNQRAADIAPTIRKLQAELQKAEKKTSLQAIAAGLNEAGIPTATGSGQWTATQVARVLARLG
jgi:DNA invertase Pin-like site-specific DNA recombinase